MKWKDYHPVYEPIKRWKQVDVECPNCGAKIYIDTATTYLSLPQKYKYKCFKCEWWDIK